MRPLILLTACALTLAANPWASMAQHAFQDDPTRTEPWGDTTLELAAHIPIQDGGRIKPFSTLAGFTMLRLNGKRSLETPRGEKIGPTAWALDVMFFPIGSADYESFLVENDEVIAAIGLRRGDKKKRDHYSYSELEPGLPKLLELEREYRQIPDPERTTVQRQVVILASNVRTFSDLASQMGFVQIAIPIQPEIRDLFDGAEEAEFHEVLPKVPALDERYRAGVEPASGVAFGTLQVMASLSEYAMTLALLPPAGSVEDEPAWLGAGESFDVFFGGGELNEQQLLVLANLREMVLTRTDPPAFESALSELLGLTTVLAEARGEYDKIPLEVSYYKANLIMNSLVLFILAFLTTALLWLRPRSKAFYGITAGAVFSATVLLIVAITMRCVIRGRPPVSTLYETLLFVTAVGCIVALATEWINRRRIALSIAAVLGMIGLFLANGYETLDKQDTMPSLVAVLDTNFWLATHVTAITTGYAAGMLAALLASFYLIAKLCGFRRDNREFYSSFSRMVYGIICFAVIFSAVGTILGGVWANDSWGRFWGWDPKENGALLIVLSQLAILHGRMGGYLREHGICMAAAFGGTIIAFSWFGVNLLGVGLHSYGFTSGIHQALWTYYIVQWGICGLGAVTWLMERNRKANPAL